MLFGTDYVRLDEGDCLVIFPLPSRLPVHGVKGHRRTEAAESEKLYELD